MRATRRHFLAGAGACLAAPLLPGKVFAASPTGQKLHGLSAFGDLKYPPAFKHFDYVNADAPKGGNTLSLGGKAPTIRTSRPSTRSTVSWRAAMRRRAWRCVSIR